LLTETFWKEMHGVDQVSWFGLEPDLMQELDQCALRMWVKVEATDSQLSITLTKSFDTMLFHFRPTSKSPFPALVHMLQEPPLAFFNNTTSVSYTG
jgi:hypothetical protein